MSDKSATPILVVDDEGAILRLMGRVLQRGGYTDVSFALSSEEARVILANETIELILTDVQMPGESGLDFLADIHETMPEVATLMITGIDDMRIADKALDLGAYGYLVKPLRASEVLIGVINALKRRSLEIENADYRARLEEKVRLRTSDLWTAVISLEQAERDTRASRTETINRLARAAEFRDEETGRHVLQMSRYCEILAVAAGVDNELRDSIREAGSLHDVGKIGIRDQILLAPRPLTPEEQIVMQTHAQIGHRILSGSESPLLQLAAEIALSHHEKFDGSGYPNGLAGAAIPLAGRIAAIADVYDALTTNRVYRKAYPLIDAIAIMKQASGTHFDPELLSLFWDSMPEILAVGDEAMAPPDGEVLVFPPTARSVGTFYRTEASEAPGFAREPPVVVAKAKD